MKKSKKIVLKSLSGNLGNIIVVIFNLILTSLLSLVSPIIYKVLIDNVIPNKDKNGLVIYLILMIIIPWLITLVASVKNYFSTKIGEDITNALRINCFDKALHARQETFEKITPPQIVNRITRECGRIGEVYVTKDLVTFVSEIISLTATLITMLVFNASLTCVCIIAFPISVFLTRYVSKKSKALDAELVSCLEKGNNFFSEVLNKIKTIKLKNAYDYEADRCKKWLSYYCRTKLKNTITHSINGFLLGDFIINTIYGIMFFISGLLVINGVTTIGTLVSFVAFIPKVYSSLKNVLNIKITTNIIENAFGAIEEILDLPQENTSGLKVGEIYSLSFNNVSFKYNRNDFGIDCMNFNIKKGQIIGIVGRSGGGKTTIFDLLTGLYYPQKGAVRINEIDTASVDVNALRDRISVVTQDIALFHGSIQDNILFNNTQEVPNLREYLQILSLDDFIAQLPDGMQTNVGYNGELLSGGERQRIALANALLKNSDVILLDEFTSALDLETERKVMNHIFGLKDKIIIIISHRIYALMNCDEIYVISNGKIIEQGKPTTLSKNEQSYFNKMLNDMNYS